MKRTNLVVALVGVLGLVLAAQAFAAGSAELETRVNRDVTTFNAGSTGSSGAGAAVVQTLQSTFNVTEAQIAALRAQDLGYGEIAIVLALAQTMQGGITQDTINSVLAMRQTQSDKGWGSVARSMGVNLGKVASTIEKAEEQSGVKPEVAEGPSDNGGKGRSDSASSHSSDSNTQKAVETEVEKDGGEHSATAQNPQTDDSHVAGASNGSSSGRK